MSVSKAPRGFSGLSTDTKPLPRTTLASPRAAGYAPSPKNGDKFVEIDTLDTYTYVGDQGWQKTI